MTLEIIGMEIKDTTLSGRTKNALRYAGIDYVSVLTQVSANDLLKIPNLGRKSIEEIIELLSQYGHELQGQDKFYKQKKKLPWVVKLIEEAVSKEREDIYDIVMVAPFKEMSQEEFDGEVGTALKSMAFSITAAIRARGNNAN